MSGKSGTCRDVERKQDWLLPGRVKNYRQRAVLLMESVFHVHPDPEIPGAHGVHC